MGEFLCSKPELCNLLINRPIIEDYLKENFNFSPEDIATVVSYIQRNLVSKCNERWRNAYRKKERFESKNVNWLDGQIRVPLECRGMVTDLNTSVSSSGRPSKPYEASSEKTKKRKNIELIQEYGLDCVLNAYAQELRSMGETEEATIVNIIRTASRNDKKQILKYVTENPEDVTPFTKEEALRTFIDREQYGKLRLCLADKNCTVFPSYPTLLEAKKMCYPPDSSITITNISAKVNLQDLLDHTAVPVGPSRASQRLEEDDLPSQPSTSAVIKEEPQEQTPVIHGSVATVVCPNCNTQVKVKDIEEPMVDTRSIIAKVYHFLEQEYNTLKKKYADLDLYPLMKICTRTAEAFGVSMNLVKDILEDEPEINKVPPQVKRTRKRKRYQDVPVKEQRRQAESEIETVIKLEPVDDETHMEQAEPASATLAVHTTPPDDPTHNSKRNYLVIDAGKIMMRHEDKKKTENYTNDAGDITIQDEVKNEPEEYTFHEPHTQGETSTTGYSTNADPNENELSESDMEEDIQSEDPDIKIEEIEFTEEGFT